MGIPEIGAVAIGIAGLAGLVYAALRFQREDAGQVVAQQTQVLTAMRDLNTELTAMLDRCREERRALEEENAKLRRTLA